MSDHRDALLGFMTAMNLTRNLFDPTTYNSLEGQLGNLADAQAIRQEQALRQADRIGQALRADRDIPAVIRPK
jgi:hypothetical protein